MVTQTLHCPACGSDAVIRHGTDAKGVQRHRCRACSYTFRQSPKPQGYTEEEKAQILAAYQERTSLRGLTRIFGVSRNTVSAWLKEQAEALPPLEETLPLAEAEDVLELDELWSFVRCKAQVRWLWIALCRRTPQVVAYVFGDRSEQTCRRLWERIPEDSRQVLLYSDFWQAYQNVLPEEQHEPVGKESGQTNHVERWNLTLRQRLGRFVRRTLSFSTCDAMHEICLRLFLHQYNRGRAGDHLYQP